MNPGSGVLRFVRAGDRTVVHTARATSPMHLLLPRNHGDAAWVYVASFGGGLVDGDALSLTVDVAAGASALLATQASTKVYRAARGTSQTLRAHVSAGALLAIVPDPVTCFADAVHEQRADVQLADETATLVLVDALTCGRAARGERWGFARYASRTRVSVAGHLSAHDAMLLDREQGELAARMGRIDALATVFAVGPSAAVVRERLVEAATPAPGRRPARLHAVTELSAGACVGRIAADSPQEVAAAIRWLLAPLARELGDDPFARRVLG